LERRLGEPHSQPRSCRVEKNLLPLPGIIPRPFRPYLVGILTELFQLMNRDEEALIT
jgi:hypothetical protein